MAETDRASGGRARSGGRTRGSVRPPVSVPPASDPTRSSGPTGGAETTRDRADAAHDDRSRASVCPVAFCPICTAVSTVNRASPEVVEHLLIAGQQFLLALKALVDARVSDLTDEDDAEPPSMQRIDIG